MVLSQKSKFVGHIPTLEKFSTKRDFLKIVSPTSNLSYNLKESKFEKIFPLKKFKLFSLINASLSFDYLFLTKCTF